MTGDPGGWPASGGAEAGSPTGGVAGRQAVRVYEVGPRDGLQNESRVVSTEDKRRFVGLLAAAGLREIEATSFVSPRSVPQLADADELVRSLPGDDGIRYPVLVPNARGLERAEAAGARAVAVFTAATDEFTHHNIGMSVQASLDAFRPVLERAGRLGWWRRAYVSTAFGCPYSGRVEPGRAVAVALRLLDLGIDEVCFGDTIGVAVPTDVRALLARALEAGVPVSRMALHFHDTRGTALANVVAGLEAGVRCFDASAGGTGGCPYAPGAAGNLATEDLVFLLDGMGFQHGVDLPRLLAAAQFMAARLGRPLSSRVGRAGGWDPATGRSTGADGDAAG